MRGALPVTPLGLVTVRDYGPLKRGMGSCVISFHRGAVGRMARSPLCEGCGTGGCRMSYDYPEFNSNRTGNVLGRAVHNASLFVVASMYGCDLACAMGKRLGRVSPSSRCRSLGEVVTTTANGTHHVGIVVPFLCRDERRGHAEERSLSYTLTLRRLSTVNISGVVAFSTRSPHMRGTVPLDKFSDFGPRCRFLGTLFHRMPSLGTSGRRLVVVDPSRKTVRHTMCFSGMLNISVNVFCGHHSCSAIVGKGGPVITRRFLNSSIAKGSILVISSVVSSKRDVLSITGRLGRHGTKHIFMYAAFKLFASKFSGFSRCCGGKCVDGIVAAGLACLPPRLCRGPCFMGTSVDGFVTLVVSSLGRSIPVDSIVDPASGVRTLLRGHRGKLLWLRKHIGGVAHPYF